LKLLVMVMMLQVMMLMMMVTSFITYFNNALASFSQTLPLSLGISQPHLGYQVHTRR